ncbi:ABC transporter substrate-binding protein [Roseomonas sp. E05]|uniref:ABC transporter substrate-binding protein n=1 Tax=Roseomonas sp. E05 TaxID=3046310 RepID=UPI0024BB55A6|nr:ABC transporter substrate-binding protein [Roseomonas sp. E05]MDJ0391674.1 ABC transporter substrate-binding protein [Roseomonas sp. E05]
MVALISMPGMCRAWLLGCSLMLAPAVPQALAQSVLRVAPGGDIPSLDPTGPAGTQTYIHGMMVYDTLFAQDENLGIHPQMVGEESVSTDKLSYRFKLRPHLKFHDGSEVTTRDVVASLNRWMELDTVGRTMAVDVAELQAEDEKTFIIKLRRPFPVRQALANSGSGLPVILREKEALGGRFTRETPIIGSGPFRFLAKEWIPGAKFAYERFEGYVSREEPTNGMAGGKVAKVDRVEFTVMPDASTKANALMAGEIDFIDQVPFEQAELLASRRDITVSSLSRIYNTFFMRPNSLYPPFDNVKARQALALAVNQPEYMAVSFVRPEWGQPCLSFFVCGSPNGVTDGSEPYQKTDLEKARQLLAESGYKGEKVVLLNSRDVLFVAQSTDLAAENLRKIGLNIEMVEADWGTYMARRNNKAEPSKGGWNLFITSVSGSGIASPLSNSIADTTCGAGNFAGWACDDEAAALRDAYIHEPDEVKQRGILKQLSRRLWKVMPTVVLGQRAQLYAWRNNIRGFVHSPSLITVFWNIEKS